VAIFIAKQWAGGGRKPAAGGKIFGCDFSAFRRIYLVLKHVLLIIWNNNFKKITQI
jgi:hypothetical protein